MNYAKIEFETWKRAKIFQHFIKDVRCVITLTTGVDVTGLPEACKEAGYRFYPVFLYLVARVVNAREEFRHGYDESGALIVWDEVWPSYPVFHPEDELFTRLVTAYSPQMDSFYHKVVDDMERHKGKRGHEIEYDCRNTFDASCLPWISYSAFDLHVYDQGCYLAPVITWGRHLQKGGKRLMPLTLQIHHAVADGFHAARFFSDVQAEIKTLTQQMK